MSDKYIEEFLIGQDKWWGGGLRISRLTPTHVIRGITLCNDISNFSLEIYFSLYKMRRVSIFNVFEIG